MALPVKQQIMVWSGIAAVFIATLWAFGDVLLPFVLGAAIAYFLDPVADRLEAWGLSRVAATGVITVCALIVFVLAALALVPLVLAQAAALVDMAPDIFARLHAFVLDYVPSVGDAQSPLRKSLASLGATIQARGGEVVNTLISSAASFINLLLLLVIVPVVAVYLLLDWDRMIAQIDALLPRDHAPVIRELAGQIDSVLASFIRGMGTVSVVLGTYYAIALMLAGLQFGLFIGVVAGLVTFIPYVGALLGGALAIGLALFQFWGDPVQIGIVAGIFVFGQFIEGNFLTPRLVGKSVGLHPVWLLLALSVFGSSFGFVGMLVAVPLAAALGVVARFVIARYRRGRLYHGLAGQKDSEWNS